MVIADWQVNEINHPIPTPYYTDSCLCHYGCFQGTRNEQPISYDGLIMNGGRLIYKAPTFYYTLMIFLLGFITGTIVHVARDFNKVELECAAEKEIEYQNTVERHCSLAFPNPSTSQEKCIQEKSVLMAMKLTGLR